MVTLDKIVALCKRRGFVFSNSEIYGGLNGVYDMGPLGAQLKNTIKQLWTSNMQSWPEDVLFFDGALLGTQEMWKASGHLDSFSDSMIDCMNCKKRYREDEDTFDKEKACPSCGIKNWTQARQFNLMFKTNLGALQDSSSAAYLRPETIQTIFVNFKNIVSTTRAKLPFGIAQIGKAFRNEITPKQFLFRMREFEQMELGFFCKPTKSDQYFEIWQQRRLQFYHSLGLNKSKLRLRKHSTDELAHYSQGCYDIEYQFPFGFKELEGISHRSDYDLKQHRKFSGKELGLFDQEANHLYMPHVIECSVGIDRLLLSILFDAYHEDTIQGDTRIVLKMHPHLAPVTAAIFPLSKKLSEQAHSVYKNLKKRGYRVQFDDNGSIGKRYRRHDEIGTPVCCTFDFQSSQDGAITVRDRNTLQQERIAIDKIETYLINLLR